MDSGHELSAILKRIRQEAGLSQEGLMEVSGVHRTLISEYERGKRVPKVATIERFARALDVPLGDFFASLGDDESPRGGDGSTR